MTVVGEKPRERVRGESYQGTADDVGVEGKFKPTLVARAKKRMDGIKDLGQVNGARVWAVEADPTLGDQYDTYRVALSVGSKRYGCSCAVKEYRAKSTICSHVLAVILWRNSQRKEGVVTPASVPGGVTRPPVLSPSDEALTPLGWHGPPEWLSEYRPHQITAADEILDHFENGARVVYLDAPTGSGKTAIADLVSRLLKLRAIYVCSSKQLQDQVETDFPYADVVKGRANYPTQHGPDHVTCADCDATPGEDDCTFCESRGSCPYAVAKRKAGQSQMAVLNTAYWMREVQSRKPAFSRPMDRLLVIDECDTLESMLMGVVQFDVSKGVLRRLGIEAPRRGSHHPTIAGWLREVFVPAVRAEMHPDSIVGRRRRKVAVEQANEALRLAVNIEEDSWIRDNGAGPLVMKPLTVAPYGQDRVWRHGQKVLMMSATIISADQMNADLGNEGEYAVVRVPMTFPKENRMVHVAGVTPMTQREKEKSWPVMAGAIVKVVARHPGERVLVHTVSYDLANFLARKMHGKLASEGRVVLTYANSGERMDALENFRRTDGAVLLAPSFDRGVDLKDDDCRVVVVAKIPYPYMGDPQINARLHAPGGQGWFSAETVRSLVQMTGRAVRHDEDWCTSYVLDAQFNRSIWKHSRDLLPDWWTEALDRYFPVKELL